MRVFLLCLLGCGSLTAMPCPDFQKPGTANFSGNSQGDIGTTVGIFNHKNFKVEGGFDFNVSNHAPLTLAAKIGFDEDIGSFLSPSFAVGMFNAEIRPKHAVLKTSNILFAITSKSYKDGRAHLGIFHGNRTMGKYRDGYFLGYNHHLSYTQLDKFTKTPQFDIFAEYVSGKSSLGSFKTELKYYIRPWLSIKAGPTWYFNAATLERSKWSFEKARWIISISVDV